MSLTGNALPLTLGVVAVVLFMVLVLGIPSTRHRVLGAVLRGLTAIALNLAVLGVAFALLNDQYAFYVTWQDLLGPQAPAVRVRHGGSARQAIEAKVTGPGFSQWPEPTSLPALPSAGQRYQNYPSVHGSLSRFDNRVLVHLPPGYDPTSPRRYPVIVALHGFPEHPGGTSPAKVQDLTGGYPVDSTPKPGTAVQVVSYNSAESPAPISCTTKVRHTTDSGTDYPRFDCTGFVTGSSGSPWIAIDGGPERIVGVLGGLKQGGCTSESSFSAPVGNVLPTLISAAERSSTGMDVAPGRDDC